MRTFKRLARAAAVVALGTSAPALCSTLTVDGSGKLTGATGIFIGGQTYSVEFIDGTCDSLFDNCSSFTFNSQSAAIEAAQALLDQVFNEAHFDADPSRTFGCDAPTSCKTFIPWYLQESDGKVAMGAALNYDESSERFQGLQDLAFGDVSSRDLPTSSGSLNYARFTLLSAPVPEPATWAMMLLGFVGIGSSLRRRRELLPARPACARASW